jgi:hypothetical protein
MGFYLDPDLKTGHSNCRKDAVTAARVVTAKVF